MAAAIRVSLFGGIIPRLANRGLPDNAAQFALNSKLYSGELRAWNQLRVLAGLPSGGRKSVYHYQHNNLDRYLSFVNYTNVVKAPLINETAGRLYWTDNETGGAFFNTTQRIEDGNPAFNLGLGPPTGTFTVVPSGGTIATAETRVYLAIWVGNYGEESGPGTPVTVSGNADGTWTVNGLSTLSIGPLYSANRAFLRLYRTITSATGVDYRMVNEWATGGIPASYVDNVSATTLSSRPALQSLSWEPPPTTLRGLIGVAGGFLAGYTGRTVRLSVPYQPHAWPEDYQFSVEDDVVGLGTFGNTIVICTKGRAFLLFGQAPDVMSLMKLEGIQPCLSARSIVSTQAGTMYASTDGLVLVDGGSNRGQIVSRNWVTKDEWMQRFSPRSQMSSVYQDRYLSFYTDELGFTVGFDDPVTGFTELQLDGVTAVDVDALTGQTLIVVGSNVYEWDGQNGQVLNYLWKSKPFLQNKPVNFAVIQLRGNFVGSGGGVAPPPAQGIGGYAMNRLGINKGKTLYAGSLNGPPAWMAMGSLPVPPSTGPEIAVKVYGDGVLRWFGAISDEKAVRLPSGYKATMWEVEVEGASPLYSITLCDTAKGLENMP